MPFCLVAWVKSSSVIAALGKYSNPNTSSLLLKHFPLQAIQEMFNGLYGLPSHPSLSRFLHQQLPWDNTLEKKFLGNLTAFITNPLLNKLLTDNVNVDLNAYFIELCKPSLKTNNFTFSQAYTKYLTWNKKKNTAENIFKLLLQPDTSDFIKYLETLPAFIKENTIDVCAAYHLYKEPMPDGKTLFEYVFLHHYISKWSDFVNDASTPNIDCNPAKKQVFFEQVKTHYQSALNCEKPFNMDGKDNLDIELQLPQCENLFSLLKKTDIEILTTLNQQKYRGLRRLLTTLKGEFNLWLPLLTALHKNDTIISIKEIANLLSFLDHFGIMNVLEKTEDDNTKGAEFIIQFITHVDHSEWITAGYKDLQDLVVDYKAAQPNSTHALSM